MNTKYLKIASLVAAIPLVFWLARYGTEIWMGQRSAGPDSVPGDFKATLAKHAGCAVVFAAKGCAACEQLLAELKAQGLQVPAIPIKSLPAAESERLLKLSHQAVPITVLPDQLLVGYSAPHVERIKGACQGQRTSDASAVAQ